MVRFGICGCGDFIANAVLPMMSKVENATVTAAFDVNSYRLSEVCSDYVIKQPCATFDELLSVEGIDAVYVASPNAFHRQHTIAAARAGKHVFCQKPLGMNATECREMIDVCHENGVSLGVGFCYRFHGAQRRAKELICEGAIGEISYMHASFSLRGYTSETVGWRCDPKLSGGGPLMDVAPHLIDLASFLLVDNVESVMAYVRPKKTETETETDVLAVLEFFNGARASLDTSFVRGNTHNYTIVGSKGQIHAVGTMPWLTQGRMTGRLILQIDGKEDELSFSGHEHIEEELRSFCRAVENGEEPPVEGKAGLHVQAVVDAIYESGRTGCRCPVARF